MVISTGKFNQTKDATMIFLRLTTLLLLAYVSILLYPTANISLVFRCPSQPPAFAWRRTGHVYFTPERNSDRQVRMNRTIYDKNFVYELTRPFSLSLSLFVEGYNFKIIAIIQNIVASRLFLVELRSSLNRVFILIRGYVTFDSLRMRYNLL